MGFQFQTFPDLEAFEERFKENLCSEQTQEESHFFPIGKA